ncbi:hypothetical protein GCM10023091_36760 [Ravibacter arvi]|uniref:FecR family protein n=1 Tax=Ravibacter arvi TaxID=2051041 RepID=A0ABP8M8I5_9BACT
MKPYSDYISYDAEAFLADPSFRAWIAGPTPEMKAYWQGLLKCYPHLRHPFGQAQLLAQGMESTWISFSQTYVDELFRKTLTTLPAEQADSPVAGRSTRLRFRWAYAAAVLFPLVSGLLVYDYFFREKLIQTGNAEVRTLTLYDGSEIKLNANSQLRLPSRFKWRSTREVWFTGEGSFFVQKQLEDDTGKKRKFTVHTERAEVAVLGTRFTVYNRSQRTRILLEEGRIALTDPVAGKMFLMKPGQVASYKKGDGTYRMEKADAEQQRPLTAWRSHLLVFENAPMTELKQRFQEVYGIELVMEGEEFKEQYFTGELPLNDTQKALIILSEAFGLEAVPYQDRIYFLSNP